MVSCDWWSQTQVKYHEKCTSEGHNSVLLGKLFGQIPMYFFPKLDLYSEVSNDILLLVWYITSGSGINRVVFPI